MSDQNNSFYGSARSLARNPLGVIALFLVLVYGMATVVTAFGSTFTAAERLPLVWFLVIFPVIVLSVFVWLVARHSSKLFGPSDYKDETNYVKMQMATVVPIALASTKNDTIKSTDELEKIIDLVRRFSSSPSQKADHSWRQRILWVDDRPNNNVYERKAFESLGLSMTLASSTSEALECLKTNKFALIISDLGRHEGPEEGYVLLNNIRKDGNQTPFFIYSSLNSPEHQKKLEQFQGQGFTNRAQDLFEMVIKHLLKVKNKELEW